MRPEDFAVYETAAGALEAGVPDAEIHAALQVMLRSGSNPNPELADGLGLAPRSYLGPVLLTLSDVPRCCGPEPGMTYPVPQGPWDRRVDAMAEAVRGGWVPPPLLFEVGGHLMDGNHRHEALVRAGRSRAPVILLFDTAEQRFRWVAAGLPITQAPDPGDDALG